MTSTILKDDERALLESQLRECFGHCTLAYKAHENMATRAAVWLWRVQWGRIILSALTTGGAVGVVVNNSSALLPLVTVALSVLLLILNSYLKDLDPTQTAQKHREIASDIWNVRESYLSLLADVRDKASVLADLQRQRDDLQRQLHVIYRSAPSTDGKAKRYARTVSKANEALLSEVDINALLPDALKRRDGAAEAKV